MAKNNYIYCVNQTIKPLKKGDKIVILAPAKAIDKASVEFAEKLLQKRGFDVVVSEHCLGQHHYFSGTEAERLQDFQRAIDDESVSAIICARGGYGCIQIVDKIQWASFLRQPKWIVGYSDVTVFHQKIQKMGLQSIHATMPLNFKKNSNEAIDSMVGALTGNATSITVPYDYHNKEGYCKGELVGGNLSIIYSLIGTNDQLDFTNKILFIEDLAEQLYNIDRMFYALSKSSVLDKINGLIIGGMTDLKDTEISIGRSYQEIILSHLAYKNIPVCFNFPAGHIADNRALIFGKNTKLDVSSSGAVLNYSK